MNRTPNVSDGLVRFVFGLTIFLSAFLLFLVQPLISKIILPWFGGSTGVWATCMVFFQVMLCVGYAYAHFIQRLPLATQRWFHWGLLGVGILCLPVMPGEGWKPIDGNFPTFRILTILLLKTGLPYLALSATGPLLQSWYARLFPDSRTYRLYALSNVASLVSLLLFPLWFERTMTSWVLSVVWSIAFVFFVLGCGFVAYCVSRSRFATGAANRLSGEADFESSVSTSPSFLNYLSWLLLPAFASFLLVSGTSHLCQDIASTPFLWILPLCLYLLSFILCFDAPHWYVRRVYVVLGLIGLYGVCAMHGLSDSESLRDGYLVNGSLPILAPVWDGLNWYTPSAPPFKDRAAWFRNQVQPGKFDVDLVGQIALHCLALFSVFMICHGELTKRKPSAKYLTAFYLMISIGGAIGSASVSFLAPILFKGIWEWWFGLTLCVIFLCLLLFQWLPDRDAGQVFLKRYVLFVIPALAILGTTLFQNSSFPLSIAVLIDKGAASTSSPVDEEAEVESEDEATAIKNRRLGKPAAYSLLVVLCFVSVVGLAAALMRTSNGRWYRWAVVNAAALGIVLFYVRDALMFSVPKIFEKQTVVSELTDVDNIVWRGRNFYGSLTIEESSNVRTLQHGRIVHGTQHLDGPLRTQPSTYYSADSGVSLAIEHVSQRPEVHLGAIGLGTGTLASFAAPNWSHHTTSIVDPKSGPHYKFTVYEINPLVVELSEAKQPWFSYLADARERGADVKIVLGDARLMMERQEPQNFDVLAVDAFSSDSIPVHLLTDEAMSIYRRHLRDDGILAIHISNRYLDLEPVCKALAAKHGYEARVVEGEGEDSYSSTWVLLTRDISLTSRLDDTAESSRRISEKSGVAWNDAFSSLYEVLINTDFDNAVLTLSKSDWYKGLKAKQAAVEIEVVPRWWKDESTYCRTIDRSDSNYAPEEVRFRDWRLQRKQNDGWVDIDEK